MNRDEAVKKLAKAGGLSVPYAEDLYDSIVLKPTVPQYVADWYEDIKYNFYGNLECRAWDKFELLAENNNCILEKPLADNFTRWYYNTENAIQILINMHQFGYDVEKEKRYTAKLKLTNEYLVYYASIKDLHHAKTTDNVAKKEKVFHFTEDDLVKYHIWENENYEIKEVEEE